MLSSIPYRCTFTLMPFFTHNDYLKYKVIINICTCLHSATTKAAMLAVRVDYYSIIIRTWQTYKIIYLCRINHNNSYIAIQQMCHNPLILLRHNQQHHLRNCHCRKKRVSSDNISNHNNKKALFSPYCWRKQRQFLVAVVETRVNILHCKRQM